MRIGSLSSIRSIKKPRNGFLSAPAIWTPASELAGTFSIWLDCADRSTFTLNSANVSRIADKSGSNNHAIQNTAANQPIDATTGFRTNAVPRYFNSTLPSSNDSESIFAVLNIDAQIAANQTILGPTTGDKRQFRVNGNKLQLTRAASSDVVLGTVNVPFGVNVLLEMHLTLNSPIIFGVNGVMETTAVNHTPTFGAANTSQIGASMTGENLVGVVREILTKSSPPAALTSKTRAYLKNKWSIA